MYQDAGVRFDAGVEDGGSAMFDAGITQPVVSIALERPSNWPPRMTDPLPYDVATSGGRRWITALSRQGPQESLSEAALYEKSASGNWHLVSAPQTSSVSSAQLCAVSSDEVYVAVVDFALGLSLRVFTREMVDGGATFVEDMNRPPQPSATSTAATFSLRCFSGGGLWAFIESDEDGLQISSRAARSSAWQRRAPPDGGTFQAPLLDADGAGVVGVWVGNSDTLILERTPAGDWSRAHGFQRDVVRFVKSIAGNPTGDLYATVDSEPPLLVRRHAGAWSDEPATSWRTLDAVLPSRGAFFLVGSVEAVASKARVARVPMPLRLSYSAPYEGD